MAEKIAKPFLKWAGGKTQLINEIKKTLPSNVFNEKFTYLEPFVGSGAILFWMLDKFPNMERAVINDINSDLINTYRVIASSPKELIRELRKIEQKYHDLNKIQVILDDEVNLNRIIALPFESKEFTKKSKIKDKETEKINKINLQNEFYNHKRDLYNTRGLSDIEQAALFIFLNKTGFNGIYRVNGKNGYNVPKGSNVTPTICDEENIYAVSKALKKVTILEGSYKHTLEHVNGNSFFYFDPPYKPLNETSSFNSYAKDTFDDKEQEALRDFCKELNKAGHNWMLSNSDVKNINEEDSYFDDLYSDFIISRVKARRNLNSNGDKRGKLNELLITNYTYEQALQTA